jgi:3-oxoacyl-[acyl-carrier protein] reductase
MNENKNAVWITGASSGIGKSITKILSENYYNIVISSRNKNSLDIMVKELNNSHNVLAQKVNVTDFEEVQRAYSKIKENFQINCLINNAGVTSFKSVESNTVSEINAIINTNLLGSIYTIKTILPDMIKNKAGIIINIISVAAIKIFTNSSAYAASKSGLLAYSNVLREEVRGHNIKVVNILPGATKTPIWPNEVLQKYSDRMMSPEDIAEIILNVLQMKNNVVPEQIVMRPQNGDL